MKNKYVFVTVMLLAIMLAGVGLTNVYVSHERGSQQKNEFRVVASFYPTYIAVQNIISGCDGVTLQNLSGPQTGCLHDYQMTTEDMKKLSTADAFIINGGGIESFLADTAGQYPELTVINACERVELLEDNAHAWMSIPDYMTQVQTIADGLAALDAQHRAAYQHNCADYIAKLEILRQKQQETAQAAAAQNVVIFHEAFAYIARDFRLTVSGSMDLDEERRISAGEIADILGLIQNQNVNLILAEELYGKEMCDTVQREADVNVVYLDTCVRGAYEADSYLKAMEKNLELIKQALAAEK